MMGFWEFYKKQTGFNSWLDRWQSSTDWDGAFGDITDVLGKYIDYVVEEKIKNV